MITVYGADWCEDTRRSLRHLRRLAVPHVYRNVDEDLDALDAARAFNEGKRRTPTIDLGLGGRALVEPDNDTLTGALVELEMLTDEDAHDRLSVQNVGDFERVLRTSAGLVLLLAGTVAPRRLRWALRAGGAIAALSGASGWCPVYHRAGVSSLDGPGDRPDEAHRRAWLAPRRQASVQPGAAARAENAIG
jgi:mycoredoxin